MSDYRIGKFLGRGAYGDVHEIQEDNGEKYCLKSYYHINPQCVYGNVFSLALIENMNIIFPYGHALNNIIAIDMRLDSSKTIFTIKQDLADGTCDERLRLCYTQEMLFGGSRNDERLASLICQIGFMVIMMNNAGIAHNDLYLRNIVYKYLDMDRYVRYLYKGRSYVFPCNRYLWKIIDYDVVTTSIIDNPTLQHLRYHGTRIMDNSYIEAKDSTVCHITEYNVPWYKRDFLSLLRSCITYTINPYFRSDLINVTRDIIYAKNMDSVHNSFLQYIQKMVEKKEIKDTIVVNVDSMMKLNLNNIRSCFNDNVEKINELPRFMLTNNFYRDFLYTKTDIHFLDIIKEFFDKNRVEYGDNLLYHVIGSCLNTNERLALKCICDIDDGEYMKPFDFFVYEMTE